MSLDVAVLVASTAAGVLAVMVVMVWSAGDAPAPIRRSAADPGRWARLAGALALPR